jgi:hypothetical protein
MSRFPWVLALVLATGCATAPPPRPAPPIPAPGTEELWAVYAAAVEASRYSAPQHIYQRLTPILRSTEGLRWDGEGRVLMVTWTKRKYYDGKVGQPYKLGDNVTVWLTAVPYLQRACREWGLPAERLPLRIAQAIGTPPPKPDGNDAFVQMWVDPRTFFRPCPDPEITDGECQVSLSLAPLNRDGTCPWSRDQVASAFVEVSEKHLDWMCGQWKTAFQEEPNYPWTALGYTFDWGDLLHPQGQSEYVVPPGTTVWIEGISSAEEYCGASLGKEANLSQAVFPVIRMIDEPHRRARRAASMTCW